jgi:hypothetical protein
MKNNGRQNRNNRSASAATSAISSRKSVANGGNVRTDDGSKSSVDERNSGNESATVSNVVNNGGSVVGNQSVTITDGFYFTPRGTVERIPDGYYIDGQNKLRKRRQSSNSGNAANGNAHPDRSETGEQTESTTTDFLLNAPLNVRGKRGRKSKAIKEETSKITLVTALSTASVALFSCVELLTKHEHWALEKTEAQILAESLNDALATLPAKYYDSITAIIEKYVPWINLAFVVGAIIVPRIEASSKQIETGNNAENKTDDRRDARTEDNPFSNWTSLGWNSR